jgi:protein SCO1/2
MPTPMPRRVLLVATLAAGLAVLALTLDIGTQAFHRLPVAANAPLPMLWPVPSFRLVDEEGQIRTSESLRGSVWIADFIFTSCRSVCPVLSAKMVQLQRAIGDPRLRFVSFSVDPQRDTPQALRAYATRWAPDERRWTLLATTRESLAELTKGMKTFVEQQVDPDATIHTSQFYLIDAHGQVRGLYGADGDSFAELAPDARTLLSELGEAPRSEGVPATAVGGGGAGGALYSQAGCAGCHDVAAVAPPLAGIAGRTVTLSDGRTVVADGAYLRESILDPAAKIVATYPSTMPSYRGTLSDAQVTELVRHLQRWRADPRTDAPTTASAASVAVDPVCGMQVHVGPDTPHATHMGSKEYFCSEHCRDRFLASPGAFAR